MSDEMSITIGYSLAKGLVGHHDIKTFLKSFEKDLFDFIKEKGFPSIASDVAIAIEADAVEHISEPSGEPQFTTKQSYSTLRSLSDSTEIPLTDEERQLVESIAGMVSSGKDTVATAPMRFPPLRGSF